MLPGEKGLLGYAGLGAASLVVSLTAAALLYRFVEQPGIALAQRLTGRKPGPIGAPAAAPPGAIDGAGRPAPEHGEGEPARDEDPARAIRRRMRVLESGDALRAWGLLAVITWHIAGFAVALRHGTALPDFSHYGSTLGALLESFQAGVWLFFALSAYLLARPFAAAVLGRAPRPGLRRYAIHRIGRVAPVLWAVVTLCLLLYGTSGASVGQIAAMYGFAQVWDPAAVNAPVGHAWSIDVEVAYYLALPLLGLACLALVRRWPGRIGGGLAAALVLGTCAAGLALSSTWLPAETPPMHSPIGALVAFLPGVAVAVAEVGWGPRIAAWARTPTVAALAAIAGLVVFYKLSSWTQLGSTEAIVYNAVAAGLVVTGLVLWQLAGRTTWAPLRWRPVAWLGERSYSIFMGHGIVAFELRDVGTDADGLWTHFLVYEAVAVPVAVALGVVIFHLVERPLMRLSRGERPLFGGGHELPGFEPGAPPRSAASAAD